MVFSRITFLSVAKWNNDVAAQSHGWQLLCVVKIFKQLKYCRAPLCLSGDQTPPQGTKPGTQKPEREWNQIHKRHAVPLQREGQPGAPRTPKKPTGKLTRAIPLVWNSYSRCHKLQRWGREKERQREGEREREKRENEREIGNA